MTTPRRDPAGGVDVSEHADRTVAHLWGEIDDSVRRDASSAFTRAVERELPVVLDASRVEFIDSAGVAFLVQFCTIGREEGLEVTLAHPPAVVRDVLELLGLEDVVVRVGETGGDEAGGGEPSGDEASGGAAGGDDAGGDEAGGDEDTARSA